MFGPGITELTHFDKIDDSYVLLDVLLKTAFHQNHVFTQWIL